MAEAGTGFVPDEFSKISRSPRKIWQRKGREHCIFDGSQVWEATKCGDNSLLRLQLLPRTDHRLAPSFALTDDVAAFDWRPADVSQVGWFLEDFRLQQSLPGRYDLSFVLPKNAKCFGLGERYSNLDLRGARHTLCSTDNPQHDESADALYKAIPVLYTLADGVGSFVFIDTPAPQIWDLDRELVGRAHVEIYSRRGLSIYIYGPAALAKLVEVYTTLTGRASLPPRWSLGHQQSRWSYPDENTVRELASEFRERRIPCDTIVLDIDYMDDYRIFTTSPERFPDMRKLSSDLASDNFKLVTAVDPGIKHDTAYDACQQGLARDYFCKKADGELFIDRVWPGKALFPDFLRQDVREWWSERLAFYTDNGIAGIWNDMNEPAYFDTPAFAIDSLTELPPRDEQLFVQEYDGESVGHLEVRNLYGSGMAMATRAALETLRPGERPFVLTRSGYAGVQRYSAVWLGDNKSWWEHLRLSLPMLLNISLSGVAFAGVDIGGFGDDCSPEMLVRWYELGIFFPFFRNHCWLKGRAQEPFSYNAEVERSLRHLIELRYRLLPYIENLFVEHAASGAPLMRPLSWHYNDPVSRDIDDEFMYGTDILVAPILQRARTSRSVWLPEGQWYRLDTQSDGGTASPLTGKQWHYLECPLGRCPAFVRAGAILPLLDVVQHTGDYATAPVTFVSYPDADGLATGVFYQDDGISTGHRDGVYSRYKIETSTAGSAFQSRSEHKGYKAPQRKYYKQEIGGERVAVTLA